MLKHSIYPKGVFRAASAIPLFTVGEADKLISGGIWLPAALINRDKDQKESGQYSRQLKTKHAMGTKGTLEKKKKP